MESTKLWRHECDGHIRSIGLFGMYGPGAYGPMGMTTHWSSMSLISSSIAPLVNQSLVMKSSFANSIQIFYYEHNHDEKKYTLVIMCNLTNDFTYIDQ